MSHSIPTSSVLPFDMHIAVQQAAARSKSYLLNTPLVQSIWLSRELEAEVWLKLEHLQHTGSFKLRGAANKLLSLSEAEKQRGVITASTGNHGAAVAHMAHALGIPLTLFLPENVTATKVEQLSLYPVALRYVGHDSVETERAARDFAAEAGGVFVSPYNDSEVMAGQGTIAPEIFEQLPNVNSIWVPVGGGGLISGIAGYVKKVKPEVQIIGCQPVNSQVMYESVQAGHVVDIPSLPTLSDGTAGGVEADSLTFPFCQQCVDDWVSVSEDEIRAGLQHLIEKEYYLVEGAAALSLASLRQQADKWKGKQVVLILCGRKLGKYTLLSLLGAQD